MVTHSDTTWKLVSTNPSLLTTNPLPVDARRGSGFLADRALAWAVGYARVIPMRPQTYCASSQAIVLVVTSPKDEPPAYVGLSSDVWERSWPVAEYCMVPPSRRITRCPHTSSQPSRW